MPLYARGHIVVVSRTATKFEWMLLDCIESLIQLPARFVKWNGNLVQPEAWLKPEGWKALVLVMENSGSRAPGQSQGSASYELSVDRIASLCTADGRPIFLVRPKKDAAAYGKISEQLSSERIFDLEKLTNPNDEQELRLFISQLSQSVGRQELPGGLVGQVLHASRADFGEAREIVDNLKKASARSRSRVPHLRASPKVAPSAPHHHRVPLLATLTREVGSVNSELRAMSAALSEYGFSFQHFLSHSAHDWSWISQRDFAVVSMAEDVGALRQRSEIETRFERIRVDYSKLRTRRYLLDSSRELHPTLTGAILPIVSWSSSAGEGDGVLRSPPRGKIALSRYTPTIAGSPHFGVIDPPFSPSHLMVRDLRSYYRKSAVWRRVPGFASRPPKRLLSDAKHVVITALEKEYEAVLQNPLVVYKTPLEGSTKLSLVYIRVPSGELHPILVGCIGSAGRLPAALYTYGLLLHWRPRFVLMCGIAGSLAAKPEDEPKVGDLVIATETIDYEYGKIKEAFDESSGKLDRLVVSQIRAKVVPCGLISDFQQFMDTEGWRPQAALEREAQEIFGKEIWQDLVSSGKYEDPESLVKARNHKLAAFSMGRIHFGASCTGDKVVAQKKFKFQLISALPSLNNTIRSVEMEGAAIQRAIERTMAGSKRHFDFAMIRGISDDADEHKSDRWQELAAKLAGDYTLRFIGWHLGSQ